MPSRHVQRQKAALSKKLALSVVLGATAFAVRASNLFIPVLPPFKLDPRWVFSLLAADLAGPMGGFIAGLLAGLPSEHGLDTIPAAISHLIVGFFCGNLKLGWKGILLWPIFGVPAWILTFYIFLPEVIVKGGWMVVCAVAFIGIVASTVTAAVAALIERRYGSLLKASIY